MDRQKKYSGFDEAMELINEQGFDGIRAYA